MTPAQIIKAKSLVGKMPRDEIAKVVGVSVSNLKRSMPDTLFIFFNKYVKDPKLVQAVCKYYEKHGKVKTQKRFPNVRVRSVVERYKYYKPRQVRWTASQMIEAARMAGLISKSAQARFFNRPRAHEGSITSLWMKTFGIGGGNANGVSWYIARQFVRPSSPKIRTAVWSSKETKFKSAHSRTVILWVDLIKNLKSTAPVWLKEAAVALSRYQKWLWNTPHVHSSVLKMISEREL